MPERIRINQRQDGRYSATYQVNGRRAFIYGKTETEVRTKFNAVQHRTARNEMKRHADRRRRHVLATE